MVRGALAMLDTRLSSRSEGVSSPRLLDDAEVQSAPPPPAPAPQKEDGLTDHEIGVVAGEAAHVLIATGFPVAPLPMSTEGLEQLRRGERLLARELDTDGIAL
jgi:hypothetical protein